MHIIWTIIVGLLVGVVAKIIHPGKESMGCIMTTILYLLSSTAALVRGMDPYRDNRFEQEAFSASCGLTAKGSEYNRATNSSP